MGFPPDDIVYKLASMPRWQRDWIISKQAMNFSGFVQQCTLTIMKENDPEYYEKYKHLIKPIRRKETTPTVSI